MSGLQLVLVAAGLLAGLWLLAGARSVPRLPGGPALGADDGGRVRVSVVIPARDEATTLPRLLGSLAACRPGPHEVIVVDDGSSDGTAAVAASFGATVLSPPEPPAGWVGKPWACQHGADAAMAPRSGGARCRSDNLRRQNPANAGTHLLFLDADTWLAPDALPRLLAEYGGDGLLSVAPRHEADRPYEQLSAAFQLVGSMGTGVFAPTARRHEARAAFGPCLLTAAPGYRAVGGHAAVRDHVVEDVALARRYRAAGLPVRCLTGGDAVGYRMYPGGLRQLVEGWSKNIASGVGDVGSGAPLATLGAVAWVTACLSVAASLGTGLAGWATGGAPPAVAAGAYAVVAAEWWWMLRRVGRFRWWAWAAFALPLAAFLVIFANSVRLTFLRRRVSWRGRAISLR